MKDGWSHNKSLIREQSLSLSGYENNKLFQNTNDGQFFEVGSVLGADLELDSRGAAYGDLDRDGDLDLVISNRNFPHITILRNDHPNKYRFLAVTLKGTQSNQMGIGTRLTATCNNREQVRVISLGEGFLTQNTTSAWFGLKNCPQLESLKIQWPLGIQQEFKHLETNQKIEITEGKSQWTSLPLNPRNPSLSKPAPVASSLRSGGLTKSYPSPPWKLPDIHGKLFTLQNFNNKTVLLNFWATWCIPCRREIKVLSQSYALFKSQKVEIVGISLDDFEPGTLNRFVTNKQIPYPILQDRTGKVFRHYQEALELGQAGIPLSLLVHKGIVYKVYAGELNSQILLEDLRPYLSTAR